MAYTCNDVGGSVVKCGDGTMVHCITDYHRDIQSHIPHLALAQITKCVGHTLVATFRRQVEDSTLKRFIVYSFLKCDLLFILYFYKIKKYLFIFVFINFWCKVVTNVTVIFNFKFNNKGHIFGQGKSDRWGKGGGFAKEVQVTHGKC